MSYYVWRRPEYEFLDQRLEEQHRVVVDRMWPFIRRLQSHAGLSRNVKKGATISVQIIEDEGETPESLAELQVETAALIDAMDSFDRLFNEFSEKEIGVGRGWNLTTYF